MWKGGIQTVILQEVCLQWMRGYGTGTGNFKALKCVLTTDIVGVKYREYYRNKSRKARERELEGEEKKMKSFQLIRFRCACTECNYPEGFGRSRCWLLVYGYLGNWSMVQGLIQG